MALCRIFETSFLTVVTRDSALISAFTQNLENIFPSLEVRIFKQNHYFIAKWHIDAVNPSERAKKSLKRIFNTTGICICSVKI